MSDGLTPYSLDEAEDIGLGSSGSPQRLMSAVASHSNPPSRSRPLEDDGLCPYSLDAAPSLSSEAVKPPSDSLLPYSLDEEENPPQSAIPNLDHRITGIRTPSEQASPDRRNLRASRMGAAGVPRTKSEEVPGRSVVDSGKDIRTSNSSHRSRENGHQRSNSVSTSMAVSDPSVLFRTVFEDHQVEKSGSLSQPR